MATTRDGELEILDDRECVRLLGTVPVGRVAVTMGALPAIFPVNFVLRYRRIVFRTGRGTKLDAAVRSAVVAFEVDNFDNRYHSGWSVLAVGRAHDITDDLGVIGGYARIQPWVGGDRQHHVCIDIELFSGRRIVHDR